MFKTIIDLLRLGDRDRNKQILPQQSFRFDPEWYKSHYIDVEKEGIDPKKHYILHGVYEGRFPTRESWIQSQPHLDQGISEYLVRAIFEHVASRKLGQDELIEYATRTRSDPKSLAEIVKIAADQSKAEVSGSLVRQAIKNISIRNVNLDSAFEKLKPVTVAYSNIDALEEHKSESDRLQSQFELLDRLSSNEGLEGGHRKISSIIDNDGAAYPDIKTRAQAKTASADAFLSQR
ncbi:hypothetical protein [Methylobacterium pseudosasicola]|uniref:Uncharacterized protein n=1 Tax=Methylobacterium pseudosasicola TaxID=582667 RepID=A0A1I4TRV3_9HYPH|nr:hypothetical protein [Methylobacterium pseudosasicola]SFM79552.1 hypothetical protein SAMN05192568_10585 [Methylobacterium pseudosasicola]